MTKNNFNKKPLTKKIRNKIYNLYFWVWFCMLWAAIVTTAVSFNSLKNYYWWWILVAIFVFIAIIFFSLWLKNWHSNKAEKIKSSQTKISK